MRSSALSRTITVKVRAQYTPRGPVNAPVSQGVPGPSGRANSQFGASASGSSRSYASPPPAPSPAPTRPMQPQSSPSQPVQQPGYYAPPPAMTPAGGTRQAEMYMPPSQQGPPVGYAPSPAPRQPTAQMQNMPRTMQAPSLSGPLPDINSCLARSELARKEVITRTTGTKLGSIVDLWVDTVRWEVIALDLAPPLDAVVETVKRSILDDGSYGSVVLLSSLRQVGDVVLVHDENAVERAFSPLSLTTLVKLEVQTESGQVLGRVRDFMFDPDSGRVASLLYDRLGSTVLPRQTFNVYALPITEVLAAGPERIIVREIAVKAVTLVNRGILDGYLLPTEEFMDYGQEYAAQYYSARSQEEAAAAAYYYAQAQQMQQQQQMQYPSAAAQVPQPRASYYSPPPAQPPVQQQPAMPRQPPVQQQQQQQSAALPPPATRSFDDFIAPSREPQRELQAEGGRAAPSRRVNGGRRNGPGLDLPRESGGYPKI